MAVDLIVNGSAYSFPQPGDTGWGAEVTAWASAVTNGMLQKSAGSFTLLAELDFGLTYGIKSAYYKTRTNDIADVGQFRLARTDVLNWRNEANDGNLSLSVNSSNQLQFNGQNVLTGTIPVDSVNGKTGTVVLDKTDIGLGSVDNTSDANKPISSATQTALDAKQATLVSGTNIKTVNGNSLLGSGDVSISATASWGSITGTLSDQTDLQNALNAKENTLTKGNLTETGSSILSITGGTGAVIGSGTTIQVAQANGSTDGFLSSSDWTTFNSKSTYSDPLTTRGDVLVRNPSNVTARLGIGSNGQVLTSDGTDVSWQTPSGGGGGGSLDFLYTESSIITELETNVGIVNYATWAFLNMTGNSITLPVGKWLILPNVASGDPALEYAYDVELCAALCLSNGANNKTTPTLISSDSDITVLSGNVQATLSPFIADYDILSIEPGTTGYVAYYFTPSVGFAQGNACILEITNTSKTLYYVIGIGGFPLDSAEYRTSITAIKIG